MSKQEEETYSSWTRRRRAAGTAGSRGSPSSPQSCPPRAYPAPRPMPPSGIHAQIRSPGHHCRGQAAAEAARAATVARQAHRAGNPKRNSDVVRPLPPPGRGGCGDRVGDGKEEEGSNLTREGGARGPAEGAGDGGERHVFVVV
jgi:hypothetical protein